MNITEHEGRCIAARVAILCYALYPVGRLPNGKNCGTLSQFAAENRRFMHTIAAIRGHIVHTALNPPRSAKSTGTCRR